MNQAEEFRDALQLPSFREGHCIPARETIIVDPVPAASLFAKTAELTDPHSARLGTRSLDLMHAAAALLLDAEDFFSFDESPRKPKY